MRKVKFGVQALHGMPDYSTLRKVVLECDHLGFDSIWISDHLQFPYEPTLECWTVLAALAEATSRIRIGPLVACNLFRYPSLLAKMAVNVDIISKGRLDFGIGAGWFEGEAIACGIPFPRAGARVEMLDEALSVIKKLWTEDQATFKGKYYSLEKAVCLPKPVQKPYPPILIGGRGDKMLRVVAKHANAWNCGFLDPESVRQKIAQLEKACKDVSRNHKEIENTFLTRIIIAEKDEDAMIRAEKLRGEFKGAPDDPIWKFAIIGSPETCTKMLRMYADSGVTHFTLLFADAAKLKPLRLFANEVMPNFQ